MPNRRISDFPEVFDIEESIELGGTDKDKFSSLHFENMKAIETEKTKKRLENEANITIENIDDNLYTKLEVEELSEEELESGDIFIITFIKNEENNKINITLKFLVKKLLESKDKLKKSRIEGYIIIEDNEKNLRSKAREENLALPILKGYRRKVKLNDSLLKSAFFESINEYLHESKIKNIVLYKKSGNKKGIKGFGEVIKSKIGILIGKK